MEYLVIQHDNIEWIRSCFWLDKNDMILFLNTSTKLFNWENESVIYLHDFNCGLKSYKNTVVKSIEVHVEMHRYIPVIKMVGFFQHWRKVVIHQSKSME